MEAFIKKILHYTPPIQYVNHLTEHPWGQKTVRFYDPDGNLIEVGTPPNSASAERAEYHML